MYHFYRSPDIIRTIKAVRLPSAGPAQKMNNNKIPRRMMDSKLEGSRKVGES
jgi:hypothetical protein